MTAADTRVTVRSLPWYGTSTAFADEAMTAEQALGLSDLNWEVDLKPLYFRVRVDGKDKMIRSSRQAVYRKDTFDELGIVGKRYHPFQNVESFAFLDNMARDGGAKFHAAGSMGGGSKVFVVMQMPETIKVLGDEHTTYVLFITSHDGSSSIAATTTVVRLACTNMFRAAMSSDRPVFRVAHIGAHLTDPETMAAAARSSLGVTMADQERFATMAGQLASVPVEHTDDDAMFYSIMEKAMPWQTKTTAKEIEAIRGLWLESDTINDEHRFTGWGLANATTEYLSHFRSHRSEEATLKRALGVNGQVEARLAKALVAA